MKKRKLNAHAHAVTHVLLVIVLLELFRHYFVKDRKLFPIHYVIIGGIAGLVPDLDIAVYYILSYFGVSISEVHRTFSHNLFVPLFFVLLAFLSYGFQNKRLGAHHLKLRNIFLVIAFGIFMHLALDAMLIGRIIPFYPICDYSFGINIMGFVPSAWYETILPSLDAILLIIWLISLEWRNKLCSFE